MAKAVLYRGISGVVRRAIVAGTLHGTIPIPVIRTMLPEKKRTATDSVIWNSLHYLATQNEIIEDDKGRFFTKDSRPFQLGKGTFTFIGKPIISSARMVNGRPVLEIVVDLIADSKGVLWPVGCGDLATVLGGS